MLKTIKKTHKSITNIDKDQTNRYSVKFENAGKCFDNTEYLQAKAKETLNRIKTTIIQQNLFLKYYLLLVFFKIFHYKIIQTFSHFIIKIQSKKIILVIRTES